MPTKLNLQMLRTTSFDSGALGLLAMVIHPVGKPGRYSALVRQYDRPVGQVVFDVDKGAGAMQLDIDLAQVAGKDPGRTPTDCACKDSTAAPRAIGPGGYVLFYVSAGGGGYSATLVDAEGKIEFDSTQLGAGDLFAVTLLEPARYGLKNTLGSAAGVIDVVLKPELAQRIRSLPTQDIEVQARQFSSERIELVSSQGLVFRIQAAARIVIEQSKPDRPARDKPALRWQKPIQKQPAQQPPGK